MIYVLILISSHIIHRLVHINIYIYISMYIGMYENILRLNLYKIKIKKS